MPYRIAKTAGRFMEKERVLEWNIGNEKQHPAEIGCCMLMIASQRLFFKLD